MTILIIIIALALIFDYINGFHDAANSIATVVSTKVLTPFQAVLWAAIFNFVAFFIFKDHGVANTIGKTVNEGVTASGLPFITLTVILAGLISAIAWNLLTWWYGIPSSSSHTLIGGFSGAAIAHAGFTAINSEVIIKTVSFIFLAPLVGMIMAFLISIWFLHACKRKSYSAKIFSIMMIAGVFLYIPTLMENSPAKIAGIKKMEVKDDKIKLDVTNKSLASAIGLKKGDLLIAINNDTITDKKQVDSILKGVHQNDDITFTVNRKDEIKTLSSKYSTRFQSHWANKMAFGENVKWLLISFIILAISTFALFLSSLNYSQSEKWFKRMQLLSSAAFSIGHGGNDSQKVMGIITVALIAGKQISNFEEMPNWVPLACYTVIALGTMSGGWKIIKTMGTKITKVTPFEGVAAETAGALTLFITEMLKIPVSTTHTITGSIIGVGATKRLSAVRWGVTINLIWAWILTIPVSALLAMLCYHILILVGVTS
jgi:inorganic phosphate transporter, PiT family